MNFEFNSTPQIIFEVDAVKNITDKALIFKRLVSGATILIITDKQLHQLGIIDPLIEALKKANYSIVIYDGVVADPPEKVVLQALDIAQKNSVSLVIGVGGGSPMDVAKLVAYLSHPQCQQELSDIYGVENASGYRLPLIQIPTTAGTGSEVTPVAIVTTGENTKSGAVSKVLIADTVILDSALTLGLPPSITAATGIDAMVHAIEAFTSKIKKNPYSDLLAKQALCLLVGNIQEVCNNGKNIEARSNMLLGAMLAGQAFANAPVAAVHALAYPLGGRYHIPHGESNALVLTEVLRFNRTHSESLYAELADVMFPELLNKPVNEKVEAFIEKLETLIVSILPKTKLSEYNISKNALTDLASDAMLQTRLLVNNPKEVGENDALAIYEAIY